MQIDRVIVAASCHQPDRAALSYAVNIARVAGASVLVLHVEETINAQVALVTGKAPNTVLDALTGRATTALESLVESCDTSGVDVDLRVEVGDAPTEVLRHAEMSDAPLIVLARHSANRHGDRSVIGRAVRRVARNRQFPVLVLDGDVVESAPLSLPNHIMVTSDFSDDSGRGLRVAAGLAAALGHDSMTAAHVLQTPSWLSLSWGDGEADTPAHRDALVRGALGELQAQVAEWVPEGIVKCRARVAIDIPSGILDQAHEAGADIIAVPSHGKGAVRSAVLGSTSVRLLQLSRVPLLILPPDFLERTLDAADS